MLSTRNKKLDILALILIVSIYLLGGLNHIALYRSFQQVCKIFLFLIFVGSWSALMRHRELMSPLNIILSIFILILALTSLYSPYFKMVLAVLNVLLAYFFFYRIVIFERVTSDRLNIYFFVLFVIFISRLVYALVFKINSYGALDSTGGENTGYLITLLYPSFFLLKKKNIGFFFSILAFVLIMISRKRGALIGALLPFMLSFFVVLFDNKRNVFLRLIIICLSVFLVVYIIDLYYDLLFNRFSSSSSMSGRNIIYQNVYNGWLNSISFTKLLLGNGFYSTMNLNYELLGVERYAHSDWLEVLYDHGLLGFFAYITILLLLIKSICLFSDDLFYYKIAYVSSLYVFLVKSLFSGVYLDADCIVLMSIIGICLGKCNKNIRYNIIL